MEARDVVATGDHPVAGDSVDAVAAPYGSWTSPLSIEALVSGVVGLREPLLDGGHLYWLEARPTEGGRQVVVRRAPDGSTRDVSPAGVNVRSRVHEYGGGAHAVSGGTLVYSNWADGRLYAMVPGDAGPAPGQPGAASADSPPARALTPEGPFHYADLQIDLGRARVICVREDRSGPGEPVNTLVAVRLDGSADPNTLVAGADFYSSPRLSPDGRRLAWLSWNHPNMPWDGTDLWLADLDARGRPGPVEHVAGSAAEWTSQPRWSPAGDLCFVDERTGWMNLYRRLDDRRIQPLAPAQAEFAHPDWPLGLATYGFTGDGAILAVARRNGRDELWSIAGDGSDPRGIDVPFTEMEWLRVDGEAAYLVASGPTDFPALVRLDLRTGAHQAIRRSTGLRIDPADVSIAEPVEFATEGGLTANGLFYAPRNARFRGPEGEAPPLIVQSHGGPTSAARTGLSIGTQLLTSRGIAVLDVDYGGSTGYGREYRRRLEGNWGIVDVDDCVNGAEALAVRGLVDPKRLAIEGGSASGYTTLCAITFRDRFRAGVSSYGIGDLAALEQTTHKFESRYTWRLVGPYPEAAAVYRERSPVFFADRIRCPVLILQGLEDPVVPPDQARSMLAALAANRVPRAALFFEGEQHGFRKAETIVRSFEAELSFYGQVFGFTPSDQIEPIVLER